MEQKDLKKLQTELTNIAVTLSKTTIFSDFPEDWKFPKSTSKKFAKQLIGRAESQRSFQLGLSRRLSECVHQINFLQKQNGDEKKFN